MNKAELIHVVSEQSKITKKETGEVLNAIITEITKEMVRGGKVQLIGFGTFECKKRNGRTAINPRTKESVEIPACRVPCFKAGKALKDAVL